MQAVTEIEPLPDDLIAWVASQRAAGHSSNALRAALLQAGWEADMAQQALAAAGVSRPAPLPLTTAASASAAPGPDLRGTPLRIDAGDRRVAVLQTVALPRAVLFGDFLDDTECSALIELARPRLARSRTVSLGTDAEMVHDDRTSDGMFFMRGENPLVTRIEARIARLLNWPVENGEGLQILRYRPGAEYKAHYDYFDPADPGSGTILRRGGQRIATLVMYLHEPEGGGGTYFPEAGLDVLPRRGHALFFSYPDATPASKSLHGGAPVVAGEKWIAVKWLRQGRFD